MILPTVRIYVCTEPVDVRRGFDGLALIARESMGQDPRSGESLFIFANRRRNRLKALWWDRNGYRVLYKWALRAMFVLPSPTDPNSVSVGTDGKILRSLLAGTPKARGSRPKLRVVH